MYSTLNKTSAHVTSLNEWWRVKYSRLCIQKLNKNMIFWWWKSQSFYDFNRMWNEYCIWWNQHSYGKCQRADQQDERFYFLVCDRVNQLHIKLSIFMRDIETTSSTWWFLPVLLTEHESHSNYVRVWPECFVEAVWLEFQLGIPTGINEAHKFFTIFVQYGTLPHICIIDRLFRIFTISNYFKLFVWKTGDLGFCVTRKWFLSN